MKWPSWKALAVVVPVLVTVAVWWNDRVERRQTLANALIGEIAALVEYGAGLPKTTYLESVLTMVKEEAEEARERDQTKADNDEEQDLIEPIDQPPERLFVVYETNAGSLGILGSDLAEKIVSFYTVGNTLRERVRLFGGGQFMKFEPEDKVKWLEGYIKLQKHWKKLGSGLKDELRKEADLNIKIVIIEF